jgi:hypothetical protein
LRGIEGFALPIFTQIHATIGANVMIATEFTDWNQAFGNVASPAIVWNRPCMPMSRFTIWSARKVKLLPACSKKHQNNTLNRKISSIAIALSRATRPSLRPSTRISTHSATNIGVSTYHCS